MSSRMNNRCCNILRKYGSQGVSSVRFFNTSKQSCMSSISNRTLSKRSCNSSASSSRRLSNISNCLLIIGLVSFFSSSTTIIRMFDLTIFFFCTVYLPNLLYNPFLTISFRKCILNSKSSVSVNRALINWKHIL